MLSLKVLLTMTLATHASAAPLVTAFANQPHAATAVPQAKGNFSAQILPEKIKDQDVIRLSRTAKPKHLQFVSVDVARGAGLGTLAWTIQTPEGQTYNLTGAESAKAIQAKFEKDQGAFNDNLFFQNGFVATLFPLTNRLTGKDTDQTTTAKVAGIEVKMPLNNKAKIANAIPHHLHGLVYGQTAGDVKVETGEHKASVTGSFHVGPQFWTGTTEVTTTTELTDRGYEFHLKAKNIGSTPVPVAAGAHPYFMSPTAAKDSIRVHVPARKTAAIDNLQNVLPTGKLTAIPHELDFTKPTPLFATEVKGETRLDNLWVDLIPNAEGYAYAEVFFPTFKVRMTALTKNVIGIQGYAPNFSEGKTPFIALELVTNLPDPREELWGQQPTGMKVLKPGETFEYGYRVELLPL